MLIRDSAMADPWPSLLRPPGGGELIGPREGSGGNGRVLVRGSGRDAREPGRRPEPLEDLASLGEACGLALLEQRDRDPEGHAESAEPLGGRLVAGSVSSRQAGTEATCLCVEVRRPRAG